MLIRLLTATLIAVSLTASPAHAAPAEAMASFEQKVANVPPHVVEGDVRFADTPDGKTKISGEFQQGFGSAEVTDYRWVLVDAAGEVVFDLTKELAPTAEVLPPEVRPFEVEYPASVKDVLGLDFVVYQQVNLAGVKLLAETGRASVRKA